MGASGTLFAEQGATLLALRLRRHRRRSRHDDRGGGADIGGVVATGQAWRCRWLYDNCCHTSLWHYIEPAARAPAPATAAEWPVSVLAVTTGG